MNNWINRTNISNFKSIRHLELKDCKRINLFIGYPNVGKSNILEALSLFSIPSILPDGKLNQIIRVENRYELSYNATKDRSRSVIQTNQDKMEMYVHDNKLEVEMSWKKHEQPGTTIQFDANLNIAKFSNREDDDAFIHRIKRYAFKIIEKTDENLSQTVSLKVPYGENILNVLSYNDNMKEVKQWMKQEFAKFGLEYVLDKSSNSIKVQRRLGTDEVFQLPYSSIADTLQRVIFYKTAIASNTDSVLLFEEPEAHAFPPYIRLITQDIIQSTNNQFFIVTHNPIIVNDFIEYEAIRKEVAIYLIDYKEGQTTAKRLSDKELDEIYNYGEDLFFNTEKFL